MGRLECISWTIFLLFFYFFQQQTVVAVLNTVIISCLIKNTTIIWTFEIVSYAFITASTELFVGSVGSSFQTTSHSSRYTLAHLQKQSLDWKGWLAHQTYWPFITAWCFNRRHAPFLLPSINCCVIDFSVIFQRCRKDSGFDIGALWKFKLRLHTDAPLCQNVVFRSVFAHISRNSAVAEIKIPFLYYSLCLYS